MILLVEERNYRRKNELFSFKSLRELLIRCEEVSVFPINGCYHFRVEYLQNKKEIIDADLPDRNGGGMLEK